MGASGKMVSTWMGLKRSSHANCKPKRMAQSSAIILPVTPNLREFTTQLMILFYFTFRKIVFFLQREF